MSERMSGFLLAAVILLAASALFFYAEARHENIPVIPEGRPA